MKYGNNDESEQTDDDSDSHSKSKTRNKFNKCETLGDVWWKFEGLMIWEASETRLVVEDSLVEIFGTDYH